MPPTSASARTSARSTRCCAWRCRKRHPGDADEQSRLLTGTVASPTTRPRPRQLVSAMLVQAMSANGHVQVRQPPALGDAAAGQRSRSDRRSQPQPGQADRRQPADPRPTGGFQFGIGQGRRHFGFACGRPAATAGFRSIIRRGRRHHARAAASCSASTSRRARSAENRRPGHDARRAEPDRACRAKPPASSPAANSRSRSRRRSARSRSNISNMASASPSRRSCLPTAASRCASARKSASCRTKGSVKLNGFDVPALTTRRAETTVELGSGQSFMIAGLLRNTNTNNIDKAPFLGDLPILGALFRSTSFARGNRAGDHRHAVSGAAGVGNQLALPTDGYRARRPADGLEGQTYTGRFGRSIAPRLRPAGSRDRRRRRRPPLRASSCDPPLFQEGCDDARSIASCLLRSAARWRLCTPPPDLPDRGVRGQRAGRHPRRLCVRRCGARRIAAPAKRRGSTAGSARWPRLRRHVYVDGVPMPRAGDVARVAGQYGMLCQPARRSPPARSSRARSAWSSAGPALRSGLPQLVVPSQPNFDNQSMSNFGCGVNSNLARWSPIPRT
jgi:hypothetical protein